MQRGLDVIRNGLAEVWPTQGRKFVTFEVPSEGDAGDVWVQYLDGELNVSWPLDEEPAVALPRRGVRLPRGAFVSWHVPGSNAVICVGDSPLDEVAVLIDSLFAALAPSAGRGIVARVDTHG